MFKEIIESFIKARQFELTLKSMNKALLKKPKHKTYKVRLTTEQMELLTTCYMIGIKTSKQLEETTRTNNFDLK